MVANPFSVGILGVPYALGGSIPGPEQGPRGIRAAGLLARLSRSGTDARDLGDVELPPSTTGGVPALRRTDLLALAVKEAAQSALAANFVPLVLGGDHTVALGAIAASAAAHPDLGVLWIDAHPDFNSLESSVTGNPHGMVLALAAGLGPWEALGPLGSIPLVHPSRIVVLGARSIDLGERELLVAKAVRWHGSDDVLRLGPEQSVAETLGYLARQGARHLHVSIDLDVLDPEGWPGVSTPAVGGLTADQLAEVAARVCSDANVTSLDIVELNPIQDRDGQTARAALDVIEAAVGAIALRGSAR